MAFPVDANLGKRVDSVVAQVKTMKSFVENERRVAATGAYPADRLIRLLTTTKDTLDALETLSKGLRLGKGSPGSLIADLENFTSQLVSLMSWAKANLPTDGEYLALHKLSDDFSLEPRELTGRPLSELRNRLDSILTEIE